MGTRAIVVRCSQESFIRIGQWEVGHGCGTSQETRQAEGLIVDSRA